MHDIYFVVESIDRYNFDTQKLVCRLYTNVLFCAMDDFATHRGVLELVPRGYRQTVVFCPSSRGKWTVTAVYYMDVELVSSSSWVLHVFPGWTSRVTHLTTLNVTWRKKQAGRFATSLLRSQPAGAKPPGSASPGSC